MRWRAAPALLALATAACGGSSPVAHSPAGKAAARFVSAVSKGDRAAWCRQFGAPIGGPLRGPLSGQLLRGCVTQDLFLITGSCDAEASIAGSTVTSVSSNRNAASARLSSGARIDLGYVAGQWLVQDVRGAGASHRRITTGPCAGAQ